MISKKQSNKLPVSRSDLFEWKTLAKHYKKIEKTPIKDLFARDKVRFDNFHICHEAIMMDYSKQCITQETMSKLMDLARACDLEGMRDQMFSGAPINITENRAVMHTALRSTSCAPVVVDGHDIMPDIRDSLDRVKVFSDKLRADKKITHIVNIGIGGSDLGPSMVYEALKTFSDRGLTLHFVSNVDPSHLCEVFREIDAKKTLFIVTSKTFTTLETMSNAHSAKKWLQDELGVDDVGDHFTAATQNISAAKKFGIDSSQIFPIWDWVGGRYSLWSAIGISLCIALGFERFKEMLDGAHSMDNHFKGQPLEKNMPVILGMMGVWHRNFCGNSAMAIIPYDQYLHIFPSYIQQVDMESNGKTIDRQGRRVNYKTGQTIIGETGTNAQHAFFQLLHQGSDIIPCDFIITVNSQNPMGDQQDKLLANAVAQTKAFMDGRDSDDPHKKFEGNRPSNTIILDELTPYNLGMLLALYEHKIFVQGVIWNINSFDQCGVELGKVLANEVLLYSKMPEKEALADSSTRGIINHIRSKNII